MWSWQWEVTQNVCLLCVRGLYKGQRVISVSGSVRLTSYYVETIFCFLCTHLLLPPPWCRVTGVRHHARLLSENQGDP